MLGVVKNFVVCALLALAKQLPAEMFVADPSILLSGDTYYLIGTMDLTNPKAPFEIYTSKDLLEWSNKNDRGEINLSLRRGETFFGKRFVAPQMFFYKGKYYLAYSEYRMAVAKSDTALGHYRQDKIGAIKADSKQIDPFVFFDGGKIFVYFSYSDKDSNKICVAEINGDFNALNMATFAPCIVADTDWENISRMKYPTIEGPTVLKRGGKYVMFYSANDFRDKDYAVGYAVADTPCGVWKKAANNPILSRTIIGKSGAGHGDVFEDKSHRLWYVFHTHFSDTQVEPRRTAIIELRETFIDSIPHYEVKKETFRYL